MGEVWRARDRESGRAVAVKVLTLVGKLALERFHSEAALLRAASHPAIVRYVAHGVAADPGPWIAMEWIEGTGLRERLEASPLSIEDTLALGQRLAGGLAALHAAGVVHRDLKPENVLLPGGVARDAKLVDFGVARTWGVRATRPGLIVGTPGYIAPEQVRGEEVDARADVFGLGALLYECLAGRPAFEGEHPLAIFTKTLLDDPIPIAALRGDAPPELEALVRALMAKEPEARPADGAAALAALRALAGGEPTAVSVSVPRVGDDERRMVSILVGQRREDRAGQTLDEEESARERARLVVVAERFGARVEVSTSTSFAITVPRGSVGTDAPRRAVRCALALSEALPEHAMAVATMRAGSSDPRALGGTLERAAERLPRGGREGTGVAVDEVTAALLDGRFVVEPREEGLVVVEERPGPPLPRPLGAGAQLVGREAELEALRGAYARCRASGPEVAIVSGDSGAGKSRLAIELARALEGEEPAPQIVWARGDALRREVPFALAAELLEPVVAVASRARPEGLPSILPRAPGTEPATTAPRLADAIAATVNEPERGVVEAFLPAVLGLEPAVDHPARRAAESDPAILAAQVRRAVALFLSARARRRPLVLVADDAHHADEPTLRALDELVRDGAGPILVLALATEELDARFPSLFARRPLSRLTLRPLDRAASEALVRGAVGEGASDEEVRGIVEQGEGLPFHLEELARARAGGDPRIGRDSVLSLVESRIARMPGAVRRVLRAASVFGERFDAEGVRHLLGRRDADRETADALVAAVEAELVVAEEQAGVHRFRHRLVREAAYAMLTEEDRALGHCLAAEWIEDAGEARAAEVAAHYASAGRAREAARWYARAALEALRGNDLSGALALAERGLEAGAVEEEGPLACAAAQALAWLGRTERALASAELAMETTRVGSRDWLLAASVAAVAAGGAGSTERLASLGEALLALEGELDRAALAVALTRATNQLFFNGRYELAHRTLARLEETLEGTDDPVARARLCQVRGIAASHAGDHAALIDSMREAAALFESVGDMRGVCVCRANLGAALLNAGCYDEAETVLRELREIAGSLELGSVTVITHLNLAQTLLARGRPEEAEAFAEEAGGVIRGAGDARLEGVVRILTARAQLARGCLERASETVDDAIELLAGVPGYRAVALAVRAEVSRARGDLAAALAASEEAMRILAELGSLEEGEPLVRLARVEALVAAGASEEARAELESALAMIDARLTAAGEPLRAAIRAIPEHARLAELAARLPGS